MRAALAVLTLVVLPVVAWAQTSSGFVVIVHPRNPAFEVSRTFLSDVFLKRQTRWSDGSTVQPVDLPFGSQVRRTFSDEILRRSVTAVRAYWQQRVFSGRDVPPVELSATDAVSYVLSHRGAIAYIPDTVDLRGAKILRVK